MSTKKIVDYILAQPKISVPELQTVFSLDYKTARKLMEGLVSSRTMELCDDGLYYAPATKKAGEPAATEAPEKKDDDKLGTIRNYKFTKDTDSYMSLGENSKRILWFSLMTGEVNYGEAAKYYNMSILCVRVCIIQLREKGFITNDGMRPKIDVEDFYNTFGDVLNEDGTPFVGDEEAGFGSDNSAVKKLTELRERLFEELTEDDDDKSVDFTVSEDQIDPVETDANKLFARMEKSELDFLITNGFDEDTIKRIFEYDDYAEGILCMLIRADRDIVKEALMLRMKWMISFYPTYRPTFFFEPLKTAYENIELMSEDTFKEKKRTVD